MLNLCDLETFLNELLSPHLFKDYCPNGLQVEGKLEIETIVTGVSANQDLIDQAILAGADAILVHHGLFWQNENPCVVGIKQKRLAQLLKQNVSLMAYHLPLDAHPLFGNNIQLGIKLGFEFLDFLENSSLVASGKLNAPLSGIELTNHIHHVLHREPLHIPGTKEIIRTVAWCTGAAQDFIEAAISANFDAYVTGEVSERTVSIARESGIHFFAAGHHATERYGVIALGEYLASKFGIKHINIDIANPV